jgi:hypothetical protein
MRGFGPNPNPRFQIQTQIQTYTTNPDPNPNAEDLMPNPNFILDLLHPYLFCWQW